MRASPGACATTCRPSPADPTGCRPSPRRPRAELGAAGEHLLATRAEKLREEWVKRQLVEAGTARAQALGWPDAYPFTKALGERALVAGHGSGSAPAPTWCR